MEDQIAMATTTKKTTATKKTSTKAADSAIKDSKPIQVEKATEDAPVAKETELEKLVKEQAEMIAQLKAQLTASANRPADNREKVVFLWQAPVADYNVVEFGERGRYGRIVGPTGTITIPKNELSQVMDASIRHYMDMRWLVVLSGLDEHEREMFGVNYKPGEYLSKEAFMNVVGLGKEILDIYPKLCESHKQIVARFYFEAYKGGQNVEREVVVALNKLSKNEAFKAIIEDMNQKDVSE